MDQLGNAIRGGYHQVNPFDQGRTWQTHYDSLKSTPYKPPTITKKPVGGGGGGNTGLDPNYLASINALNSQIAALQAQANAAPRFYAYDTLAARSRARQQAEANINPYYQREFERYAADFNRRRGEANTGAQMGRENTDIELRNLQEGNVIEQGRTAEDVSGAMYNIANQEQQFQQGEGRAFDQQKRELEAKTAASGLATSGLGQQNIQTAQEDRNFASKGQADAFQQERQLKEQFKTRTFEDLARSDVLGKEKNVQTKKQIDFDLNKMINDLAFEETQKNNAIRNEQMQRLAQEEDRYYGIGVDEFINSLAGRGARGQDISLAIQTYK